MTGKERFRFGYEQLSAVKRKDFVFLSFFTEQIFFLKMVKEAAPILRRQKQDYEASFEVIGKLTSELNDARKVRLEPRKTFEEKRRSFFSLN